MELAYAATWFVSVLTFTGAWVGLRFWYGRKPKTPNGRPQIDSIDSLPRPIILRGRSTSTRPDGNPFYTCMMFSLFISSALMVVIGPMRPSVIGAMHDDVQRVMALSLCLGTCTCIFGFSSGHRWFRPKADLRDCYRFAVLATPTNVSTLAVYGVAVGNTVYWQPIAFVMGAGGLIAIMIAHILLGWELYWEAKRLDAAVAEAKQVVQEKMADDG